MLVVNNIGEVHQGYTTCFKEKYIKDMVNSIAVELKDIFPNSCKYTIPELYRKEIVEGLKNLNYMVEIFDYKKGIFLIF